MGYSYTMKRYRTLAVVEWHCSRCKRAVMADKEGNGMCVCVTSPSPWEHERCLNGDGTGEFVLFGRQSRQER